MGLQCHGSSVLDRVFEWSDLWSKAIEPSFAAPSDADGEETEDESPPLMIPSDAEAAFQLLLLLRHTVREDEKFIANKNSFND